MFRNGSGFRPGLPETPVTQLVGIRVLRDTAVTGAFLAPRR